MMKKLYDEFPYIEGEEIILKKMTTDDVGALKKMVANENVYRYLPTFLFELYDQDMEKAIYFSNTTAFEKRYGIFLGIYLKSDSCFCGIVEVYHYIPEERKVSLGYRLAEEYWGKGIATKAAALIIEYLYKNTDIEIIAASHITENQQSGKVLEKLGFKRIAAGVEEKWGYKEGKIVDKWSLVKSDFYYNKK